MALESVDGVHVESVEGEGREGIEAWDGGATTPTGPENTHVVLMCLVAMV